MALRNLATKIRIPAAAPRLPSSPLASPASRSRVITFSSSCSSSELASQAARDLYLAQRKRYDAVTSELTNLRRVVFWTEKLELFLKRFYLVGAPLGAGGVYVDWIECQQRENDIYHSSLAREKYPDDWEERELDGELLYEASGGIPHGHVSIADANVKKASIIPSARESNIRASSSLTLREKEQLRHANEENAQLRRTNEMLQQKTEMHGQLIITLFKEIGKEVPADMLGHLFGVQQGTTNSSQAGSQAVDANAGGGDSSEDNDANNSNRR